MAVNYKIGADVGSFKQGVSEAQASLKTLDAALKVNEASFKAGGDAQVYMQQKTQLLTDKMNKQKQLVTQLQQGLRQMREQGVSPTSTAYQQLETKLLNAQTAMLETKTSIDNLDGSQQEATKSANDLGTAVNSIGKKVSLDTVISGIHSITSAMETAAGKAVQLGETIWANVMDSAKWADDSATMALMYGVDLDTFLRVQKLVQNGMDTSVEAILKSQQKLTKNVGNGSDSFMQTLVDLGLAVQTYGKNGEVATEITDNATDLFWKAGQALMGLEDEFDKESKAQELFGKSWRELIPLFTQFKSQDEYNQALEEVRVNSEEDVSALAELNDKVGELKGNLETLGNEVWANLAPALTDAADALNGLLTSVLDYLETPKGKEALEAMGSAVSGLFDDLGKIDPEKVVQNFAGMFEKVTNGFKWIDEHSSDVVTALEVIAGGFGLLKVSEAVLTFMQLIAAGKFLTAGTAAAEAGASAGAAWGGAFAKAVGAAAPWLIGLYTLLNPSDTAGNDWDLIWDPETGKLTAAGRDAGMPEDQNAPIEQSQKFVTIPEDNWDSSEQKAEQLKAKVFDLTWDSINDALEEAGAETATENRLFDPEQLQKEWDSFFGLNPPEVETEPVVDENAAADIAAQVGTVEIPAVIMVTSDKSGPYTKLGSFSAGSPLVYYSKDLNEHANGIFSVPFDNYPALLHKDEQVVSAREVSSANSFNSNLYVEKMYMNNGTDANGLANKMAAAQRRLMRGRGS